MKENVDKINKLWLPDQKLCDEAEEFRQLNEWHRKHNNGTKPPSELGIESYIYGNPLHPKFFEGRKPPDVPLNSLENIQWYEEHLRRCVEGFEYKGTRITGDHYWFLNFTPFMVALKDANGNVTNSFKTQFGYFGFIQDYIFKLIEEAHFIGKYFMLMGGRGFGKTYMVLSILAKLYQLKPESHNIVSASRANHADEAFSKMKTMLDAITTVHPTLNLARISNTNSYVKSGQEVIRDGVRYREGPGSILEEIIYGDNSGATRGFRPDSQLMEEIGDWRAGKGNLKECISASRGSWGVGVLNKTRVFLIGTGGSVSSDQAKDIYLNPSTVNILAVNDFGRETGVFIPSHYFLGGMWERTGVNNNKAAKEHLLKQRKESEKDIILHGRLVQEFPLIPEEVFRKYGTNRFNQQKIAEQWTKLHFELKDFKPRIGFLEWERDKSNRITGVRFVDNPNGNVEIIEEPYKGPDGKTRFPNLYIAGIDGIDQGLEDSTGSQRSNLAVLIKKRIIGGKYFSETSNIYVAKYIGRSLDVRWDYEVALKLVMYYDAKVNLEYTKIGIIAYFREYKQYYRFAKRPMIALPTAGDGTIKELGLEIGTNLIGTTASTHVIDHQDDKIKEYIDDYYYNILFLDVLEQLRDYQREYRTAYDLVIAMGLCEILDEDMLGITASPEQSETDEFEEFGYYYDNNGVKHFGVLPKTTDVKDLFAGVKDDSVVRWIDADGKLHFADEEIEE